MAEVLRSNVKTPLAISSFGVGLVAFVEREVPSWEKKIRIVSFFIIGETEIQRGSDLSYLTRARGSVCVA